MKTWCTVVGGAVIIASVAAAPHVPVMAYWALACVGCGIMFWPLLPKMPEDMDERP